MNKQLGDTGIVIHYIEQLIQETYNPDIKVTGEYYTQFDMNYGCAHFIAKYLDARYPLLDVQSRNEYEGNDGSATRSITKPISLMNYFLSDNKGHILTFDPCVTVDEYVESSSNEEYRKMYNEYQVVYKVLDDYGNTDYYRPEPQTKGKFLNKNDLPLFIDYDEENGWQVNTNKIFKLTTWDIPKKIFEIDSFVASYLLGRAIGPKSTMEDIYYAQRLLIRDREITREEKGIWCPRGMEGSIYDMTQTVINYQTSRMNPISNVPLFVTGYFDIFTEGIALKEVGETSNGIYGL